jgi:hypothetical protein
VCLTFRVVGSGVGDALVVVGGVVSVVAGSGAGHVGITVSHVVNTIGGSGVTGACVFLVLLDLAVFAIFVVLLAFVVLAVFTGFVGVVVDGGATVGRGVGRLLSSNCADVGSLEITMYDVSIAAGVPDNCARNNTSNTNRGTIENMINRRLFSGLVQIVKNSLIQSELFSELSHCC